MDTAFTSFVGICMAQRELRKYSTEREQLEVMKIIHSKAITSSCRNVLYFIVAIISAGLIHWAVM